MNRSSEFSAGELVEVRSRDEILRTLDKYGQLDALPFMPQMFEYCGKQFRVFKRAHKTCDTVTLTGGRKMLNAVHLEGLRCDGKAYAGCQAGCLIFWKDVWLKRVDEMDGAKEFSSSGPNPPDCTSGATVCTEADVLAGTRGGKTEDSEESTYVCQITQLPLATTHLPMTTVSQYVEDYTSGNVTLWRMFQGFVYAGYYWLSEAGIGLGAIMRWLFDRVQSVYGGVPFPRRQGLIPAGERTPERNLNLEPGELVRVKPYKEILATLDAEKRNRGLLFDAEMVPYCGEIHRVLRRVDRILDEKTENS